MVILDKKLLLIYISAASLLFSSCIEKNNYNYPEYVYFPKEGGKMIVRGDEYYVNLYIEEDGEAVANTWGLEDGAAVSYKWLTVIDVPNAKYFKIIVDPSDIKKKRKLKIVANFGPDYGEINVIQAGN